MITAYSTHTLSLIPGIGGYEWIIILVIGLLLFGKRLPDLGRSVGKTIVEFKKGLRDVEKEVEAESSRPSGQQSYSPPQGSGQSLPHGGQNPGQYAGPGAYQAPQQQSGQQPGSNG
ncbi:MAG: twin-arginine translocase TatA/TatE family subunit [Planctomycetota bacterium]|nr:twin-arginine translocase TatA/TatE family subunit [Planctomycetota bacterium]MDA1106181.1 twin-arginine translocase TatA/TatE family subunit [Planctomycetota bacterium]